MCQIVDCNSLHSLLTLLKEKDELFLQSFRDRGLKQQT